MTISYRRTFQGGWELSSSDTWGNLVTQQYLFYTKKEATSLFRKLMKERNK
jgi:hypothetical protein